MLNRCLRLTALLLLTVSACAFSGAQAAPFTLEQLLGAPFPSGLVAAPRGGKVAWVFNHRGVRNLWVAEPGPGTGGSADYRSRPLTNYRGDNGREISDLQWTPDANAIVYVRGGDPNRQGEHPNPTSDPEGAEQAVWVISLGGGQPRRLGEGHSPAISPRGDRVAFLKKGQVWWAALDAREPAKKLFAARGQAGSLRWSPEGSTLAFVSSRGNHSFIGVYDLEGKAIRYLDPSIDRDRNPAWSPDGRSIAFLRIPASSQLFTFGPKREGQPWSIRVVDVDTGQGREVWRAQEGRGSVFRFVVADNQILWGAGDRLVFPWERDGWTHLYSVSVQGGDAVLLTPGEFEVEHVSLTPDRTEAIYSSNQDDIDRRHIWRVAVTGGPPAAVTGGGGIEWSPAMTGDGGAIALLRSDARGPARPGIVVGNGPLRDLAPEAIPADFPSRALVEPQPVIFPAADGLAIHGQLFLSEDSQPAEKRPAVIFFHGGSRRQMLLGWHYRGYYHNAYALNQYLASRGYVVLSANYRSGTGYGMEFREALHYGAHGASEFNDVLGAGLYLRSRPEVDPGRIGLWGGSYGGYLTALGLARASDLFAAGVDLHGVHDWNVVIRNFAPTYDPERQQELARLAFESSPMASVEDWRSPVLLIHGDDDRNVPFSETVDLVEKLREQEVELELLVFSDEVHGFLLHKHWLEAYRAAADFFDRHLKQ